MLRHHWIVAAVAAALLLLAPVATARLSAEPSYDFMWSDRLAGADRYATAAQVSYATYPADVPYAYVATGENFPDALSAGAAARQRGGPVLLVTRSTIPAPTAAELASLKPQRIVVVGGEAVVSASVASALRAFATTGQVLRYAGPNRYATSASVSRQTFGVGVASAYIATGLNFPDALAGVPATAAAPGPILLVAGATIPEEIRAELTRLQPKRIVILGGTSVVPASAAAALDAYTSGPVLRWAGANRYATAVEISSGAYTSAGVVFLTTGLNYPDALAGGPAAAEWGGPLLLVEKDRVPTVVMDELRRLHPEIVVLLGGTRVVSDSLLGDIEAALGFRTFDSGKLLVGGDIPPGTYRSVGVGCTWSRLASAESWDVIASGGSSAHDVVTIKPTDVAFESNCGWTTNMVPIGAVFESDSSDGTYVVGWDVDPGTYTAPGGHSCLWERLAGFSGEIGDTIAKDIGNFDPIVTIASTDVGFATEACGAWVAVP